MSIMWKYLDKRSATIAAIKDYEAMQFIIDNTDAEIKRAHEKMTSLGSPKWDGMPRTHNPQAGEERILKAIDEIDILKERYRQAVEYMDSTVTATPTAAARPTTLRSTCMSSRLPRTSGRTVRWTG